MRTPPPTPLHARHRPDGVAVREARAGGDGELLADLRERQRDAANATVLLQHRTDRTITATGDPKAVSDLVSQRENRTARV